MKVFVITLFPDMINHVFNQSIIGNAQEEGHVAIETVQLRDFAINKRGQVDDYPYGGGAGMVLRVEPVVNAIRQIRNKVEGDVKVFYMSPKGETLTQKLAHELVKIENLVLVCGHYEGLDQRAIDLEIDGELSIGDYILTGGEIAAMVIIDAIARLVPGVLNNHESSQDESFENGLLEYPHYTRPPEFEGLIVPEVLLSGHHANIDKWRNQEAIALTKVRRPDLLRDVKS